MSNQSVEVLENGTFTVMVHGERVDLRLAQFTRPTLTHRAAVIEIVDVPRGALVELVNK